MINLNNNNIVNLAKIIYDFVNASKNCNAEENLSAFVLASAMLNQNL